MAYTTDDLVARYTAANLGKAPDQATRLTIDAFATGTTNGAYTDPQALANTLKLVNGTTAVAIETRQFFVGGAPSAAGLAYLVNSTTNANDLNDAYYAKFSAENRFINFSINLATGTGEGAAAFAAAYGGTGVSYEQTVRTAYDKIIGNSVATAAGVDVEATVKFFSRAENITYLTNFVKANTGYTTASDIDLAVKAALIGEILNAATGAGLGAYATATNAMVLDLSDGTLNSDNAAGVNLFTAYPGGGVVGTTFTLAVNADTVNGTAANDTINAFTVDATGTANSTLTAFDAIDGGNGTDTLNIYTDANNGYNATIASTTTIKNIEVINIYNQDGAGAVGASGDVEANVFQGAKQIWQSGDDVADVRGVAQGQTIGFGSTAGNYSVQIAALAATTAVSIALKDAYEGSQYVVAPIGATNNGVTSVTVTGNVVDSDGDGTIDQTSLVLVAAKDATAVTVTTSVDTGLTVAEQFGSTKNINSVDASASTGAISFSGDGFINNVKTGSGDDSVSLNTVTVKDDASTAATDETFNATLSTGAGDDLVNINTTGTGATTVDTGAGDDAISFDSRGSGKVTVTMGAGNDSFAAGGAAVNATDSIDGGDGIDTLTLSLVGSANIGAFSNFEVFDVAGLNNDLDIDILASKNTVTEIIGSGALSTAHALTNLGAGVGFRLTADMGASPALTLTQKTAGALTVTNDADLDSGATATIIASNATTLNAVFSADFKASAPGTSGLVLTSGATNAGTATTLNVTSGGTNVSNSLVVNTNRASGTATADSLTTIKVTGDHALTLDLVAATAAGVTSVDASAFTGALTFDLGDMRASATYANILKLGAGDDVIKLGATTNAIQGIGLGTAEGASAVSHFDVFNTGAAVAQAADIAATGTITLKDGLLTFQGTGPATLADAITAANTAAGVTVGSSLVFQYINDSYVFIQGGATDTIVKLVGTTGLHGLSEVGATDNLYVF